MKVVELVKISTEAMKVMSNNDIKMHDWRWIKMYEEYLDMRRSREKFRWVIAHLADAYGLSESSVARVIRRLEKEVKV